MNYKTFIGLILVVLALLLSYFINLIGFNSNPKLDNAFFELHILDDNGPVESWGKSIADINGDGLLDVIIGGHNKNPASLVDRFLLKLGLIDNIIQHKELVWYENPSWKKHIVSVDYSIRTDIEVADINNDHKNDIVVITNSGVIWFKNPTWEPFLINNKKFHDLEINDLDRDGFNDIIVRNQSLFGYKDANKVYVFSKGSTNAWKSKIIDVPQGEGLKVVDINGDNFSDIVVNHYWLNNPGSNINDEWQSFKYTDKWLWDDVKIEVADVNGDKSNDIILTPSEPANDEYHISWFESTKVETGINWQEHIIDSNVESVYHSLVANDFDGDGDVDIITAEMNQSKLHGQVLLYRNIDNGLNWTKHVLDSGGLHNIVAKDIDGDYDIDFIGTNWNNSNGRNDYPVKMWINNTNNKLWKKVNISSSLSKNTLFVFSSDIDNDNDIDIVTGNYVFKNSGNPSYKFEANRLDEFDNNIVNVYDYDHDGDDDLLISRWQGYHPSTSLFRKIKVKFDLDDTKIKLKGNSLFIAFNDGDGHFNETKQLPEAKGDFLQGSNILSIAEYEYIVLSWHKPGQGIQTYKIPKQTLSERWEWQILSETSQDEALSIADIDLDGDEDILLGTIWLRNDGFHNWKKFAIFNTSEKPDRNLLKDINGDNKIDAIVGYEATSKLGKIAWYEQGVSPFVSWKEHKIADIIGPMSLDIGDIDLDGDLDIVAGEHNLKYPELSRVFVFYNNLNSSKDWGVRVIQTGDEHHDGTKLIDYDNDGDLDIISIGWSHRLLNLYINPIK